MDGHAGVDQAGDAVSGYQTEALLDECECQAIHDAVEFVEHVGPLHRKHEAMIELLRDVAGRLPAGRRHVKTDSNGGQ